MTAQKNISDRRKELYDKLQLVYWKDEINELIKSTGISLEEVCSYLGITYSRDVAIYTKVPRKRKTIIGIGMAFGLPLNEIDRWIVEYGKKRRLYAKDVFEDLIWIYLINNSYQDRSRTVNYYSMYERCVDEAISLYNELFTDSIIHSADTDDVREELLKVPYDEAFTGLKGFIIDNMDSFKTAYAKSRRILFEYLDCILAVRGRQDPRQGKANSLRGYLDESMINYLSGDRESINLYDRKSGRRTSRIKVVPTGRKAHVAMCLSLGMSAEDINEYLDKTGYGRLDPDNADERKLLRMLELWEDAHPVQRKFKDINIKGRKTNQKLTENDENEAVRDMLLLRQTLLNEYQARDETFPYMKE